MAKLYYFHDPMCSWCYAFDAVLTQIENNLPGSVQLIKIVTGLAPDSIELMPVALQKSIQGHWKRIEETVSSVQFNYDFWTINQPIRSTYPACRAVLAAKKQGADFENKMIKQIQWAYYKNAQNPSLDETLIQCAQRVGLDSSVFKTDYTGQEVEMELQKQIYFTKQSAVFSYPSLRLERALKLVPIGIDYNDAEGLLKQIINEE